MVKSRHWGSLSFLSLQNVSFRAFKVNTCCCHFLLVWFWFFELWKIQNAAVDDFCGTTFSTGLLMAIELYKMFVCGLNYHRVGWWSAVFCTPHEMPVLHPGTKHAVPVTWVLQEFNQAWSLSLAAHHAADTSLWKSCPFIFLFKTYNCLFAPHSS